MKNVLRSSISTVTAIAFAFGSLPVRANPLGGQVVTGSAAITGTGTSQVTVNQSSAKAIIDWRSFNIGKGETTNFVQPNSSAVTLNRVTGGLGLSTINGMINANGGVYVVNPDGILFGPNAKINVGSFLGTTHDIANSDFMAGKYDFTISGNPSASIVNQGSITAANGGFAALVAPGVRNDGIINARLGTVTLASGNSFTLDLYGDNLIKLQPSDAIAKNVIDAATGQTMTTLVQNTGTLKANGGTVSLSAVTARQVLDSVINSSGTIEANSVGTQNGLVVFGAPTAATKIAGTPTQTVKVSGTVKAAGKKSGTTGGKIQVTGENIQLASANLDASGKAGGGKILIGGDWKGGDRTALAVTMYGQSFETAPVPTATQVAVDAYSVLDASAIKTGNGGKVVVWSNDTTTFAGSLLLTGGTTGGNGGFAEVSGKNTVEFTGIKANLSAPNGAAGTILFDPEIENIDQTAGDTLANSLNVQANVAVSADVINVLPNVNILKTSGGDATLAFFATQGINIGANVTIGASSGKLSLYLDGDSTNGYLFPSPDGNTQSITVLQAASLPTAVLGITAAIAYPNGIPSLSSSQNLVQYANALSIPNLDGRDVYSVAQTYAATAAGLGITPIMSAPAGLSNSGSRVSIDGSARFYLNGGAYLAYGNSYQFVDPPNRFLTTYAGTNASTATSLAFANVAALYGGSSLANLAAKYGLAAGTGPYAGLTYTSPAGDTTVAALSYNVDRTEVAAPAGVISTGPIPGVTLTVVSNGKSQKIPITFSDLIGIDKTFGLGLTDDQVFYYSQRNATNLEYFAPAGFDPLSKIFDAAAKWQAQYRVIRYANISAVLKHINGARIVSAADKVAIEDVISSVEEMKKEDEALENALKNGYAQYLANTMMWQERPLTAMTQSLLSSVLSALNIVSQEGAGMVGALRDIVENGDDPASVAKADAAYQAYVKTYADAQKAEDDFINSLPSLIPN